MKNNYLIATAVIILTGCGGGGALQTNATAVRIFADNSGLIKITGDEGSETLVGYIISPNAEIASENLNNVEDEDEDVTYVADFPIIGKANGYTFHEGILYGRDTLFLVKSEENPETFDDITHGIIASSDNGDIVVMATSNKMENKPTGSFNYTGVFTAYDARYPEWTDIGEMTISADFATESFFFDAKSNDTAITGSGFLDPNSGQLSSRSLTLEDFELDEVRDASLLGTIGGLQANEAIGVWHTNEDTPLMSGGFAGHR